MSILCQRQQTLAKNNKKFAKSEDISHTNVLNVCVLFSQEV
jgi:hypothetical protein